MKLIKYFSMLLLLSGSGCVPMSKYKSLQQELEKHQQLVLEGKASIAAYRQRLQTTQIEYETLVKEVKVYEKNQSLLTTKDKQIQQLQARVRELEQELKQLKGDKKIIHNKEVEKKQKSSY